MILKQKTINNFAVFVPFEELGTAKVRPDEEFTAKLKTGRELYFYRSDFLDAPSPMATNYLSADAMRFLAKYVADGIDAAGFEDDRSDKVDEMMWADEERILHNYFDVPYYEDDSLENYSEGDEVYAGYGQYGSIVSVPSKTTATPNCVDVRLHDSGTVFSVNIDNIVKKY